MTTEQLFHYYYRPLCLYALHFLGQLEGAEDVVQDCFVKLLESPSEPENQRAWLYRAVHNHCLDMLRRDRQQAPTLSIDQLADPVGQPLDSHRSEDMPVGNAASGPEASFPAAVDESLVESSFEEARLWTAIDQLPDRCREVFLLSKRDSLTYREIASELGISERTVEHQISKALRILRGKADFIFRLLFCLG